MGFGRKVGESGIETHRCHVFKGCVWQLRAKSLGLGIRGDVEEEELTSDLPNKKGIMIMWLSPRPRFDNLPK